MEQIHFTSYQQEATRYVFLPTSAINLITFFLIVKQLNYSSHKTQTSIQAESYVQGLSLLVYNFKKILNSWQAELEYLHPNVSRSSNWIIPQQQIKQPSSSKENVPVCIEQDIFVALQHQQKDAASCFKEKCWITSSSLCCFKRAARCNRRHLAVRRPFCVEFTFFLCKYGLSPGALVSHRLKTNMLGLTGVSVDGG